MISVKAKQKEHDLPSEICRDTETMLHDNHNMKVYEDILKRYHTKSNLHQKMVGLETILAAAWFLCESSPNCLVRSRNVSGTKVTVSEKKPWCFLFLGTFPPKKQPEQVTQVGSMSLGMVKKIFLSMGPIEISGWVKGAIDYIVVYHHVAQGITNEQLNITRWFRILPTTFKDRCPKCLVVS